MECFRIKINFFGLWSVVYRLNLEGYRLDQNLSAPSDCLSLTQQTGPYPYQCGVCRAACCPSSAGSDAGSSLCADGPHVQEELSCLFASPHPETEEQGTLQDGGGNKWEWEESEPFSI